MVFSPDEMVFAHILMKRTQKNLEEMRKSEDMVSVNATLGQVSYEIMAKVKSYDTSGPNYQRMDETLERIGLKEQLEKYGMRILGVWVLGPEEVWDQSAGPKAGTRLV